MGTLDALLDEKLGVLAEEKSAKQANKSRLIADPNISVSSLMESIGNFLRYKRTKDLWALLGPPAGAAASYGWHSLPNGEWLVKVSSLLFELLGVASNSKIQSKKLHKALSAMHQQRELEVRTWAGHTSNDAIDRLDFTIRVLMSMLRQLKSSGSLKTKVFRSLPRRDQVCLDLVLQKVQLTQEFLVSGDSFVDEEDEQISQVCTHPSPPECMAMVPYQHPQSTQGTTKTNKGTFAGLASLPSIFSKILGGYSQEMETEKREPSLQEPQQEQPTNAKNKVLSAVPSAGSSVSSVLKQAMNFVPSVSQQKKKKPKVQAKKAEKKKEKGSAKGTSKKESKNSKKKQNSKKSKQAQDPPKEQVSQGDSDVYQAGDYNMQRMKWIENHIQTNEGVTKAAAGQAWGSSMKRATLLMDVPLKELKRRKFVGKECKENPFKAAVLAAQQ